MYILFIDEKPDGWELLAYQLKVERRLYLSLVYILCEISIQIKRHQQMRLIRKSITSGTGLTINNDITILNTSRNETLQGGIATLEGRSLCYFIARRQRMIMQEL